MGKIKTRRDLKLALLKIYSLTPKERKVVFEALSKDLDMGKITKFELKRTLYKLRRERKISEVDKKNLRAAILNE